MSIYLDLSAYDLTNTAAVDRFKKVVAEAIAGRPTYNFSAYHAALAWKLFQLPGSDQLAAQMSRDYYQRQLNEIDVGGFPSIKSDSYLYVGGAIKSLATTIDWCGHLLTETEIANWKIFMRQTCWNLQYPSKSNWGGIPDVWDDGIPDKYNGWSQNDPLNNYYYSHGEALEYENLVSGGDRTYLYSRFDLLRQKWREWGTGSPEGTGYGLSLSRLFQIIQTWSESTGEQFPEIEETANEFIELWIHCSIRDYKTGKFGEIISFMDHSRESRHRIYDGDLNLILSGRALSKSTKHRNMATWWLNNISHTRMAAGNYCHLDMLDHGKVQLAPDVNYYHGTSSGHYLWRSDWTKDATVIALACGPNGQAHDQDDQGEFQIYHKGYPQAVTHNIWSTSGILNDPQWHNVLCFRDSAGKQANQGTATKNLCSMTVVNPQELVMEITPAYLGKSITHTRTCKHIFNSILVEDVFDTGAYEAIFQIHTPYMPVVDGNKITAGMTTWTVEEPANAVISVIDLKATTTTVSTRGYRIEIRGGIDRYRVRGDIDTAMAPVELPGTTTPTPEPEPDPIPKPTEPPLHTALPLWPPEVTHVLTGAYDGASWHYGDPRLWVPVEQITLQHCVATARQSDGLPTGSRVCRLLANLAADIYVCMTTVPPTNLTARDVKGQMYALLTFPEQPEEDPEMIKELEAKVALLESANEALVNQLSATQTELEAAREQVVAKDAAIESLNQDNYLKAVVIAEQSATLEAQAPKIEKLAALEGAIKIINEAA